MGAPPPLGPPDGAPREATRESGRGPRAIARRVDEAPPVDDLRPAVRQHADDRRDCGLARDQPRRGLARRRRGGLAALPAPHEQVRARRAEARAVEAVARLLPPRPQG